MELNIKYLIILLSLTTPVVVGAQPPVILHLNQNNVYSWTQPGQSTGEVKFLGKTASTEDCMMACIMQKNFNGRCLSFTYHTKEFGAEYAEMCYGRVGSPTWSPMPQKFIHSGRVEWPCESDMDCSLNGHCIPGGHCLCRLAWRGHRCDVLNLLPAERRSGYHYMENGRNISSWGGPVVRDSSGVHHMFLAEMANHCGINSWTLNSQIVYAISKDPLGNYKRVGVLPFLKPFAHEPDLIKGLNGEFVLMWSANHYEMPLCQCIDGSTDPTCKLPRPAEYYCYIAWAKEVNGSYEWSKPMTIFGGKRLTDTNFAAVILENGTLVGFTRHGGPCASEMHLVVASDYKNPSTYIESKKRVWPDLCYNGVEDPFLYIDENGYFHSIFHNMYPGDIQENCGGHAYSKNGIDWTFSGFAFSNMVNFTDGGSFTYSRRERPHFIFAADGMTPIGLTNGAQYGGKYGDATYTLLQPVRAQP